MKAILFDLDGVFYQGESVIPGAPDVTRWVTEHSIPHLFVTNTTSKPRADIISKLEKFGIQTDEKHILTPVQTALNWLEQHQITLPVSVNVTEKTGYEFSHLLQAKESDKNVGAIIVGDIGEMWNYKRLNRLFRWLMQQPQPALLSLGMTRYWQAEDGLRLDLAPFVKALEYASGAEAIVLGKPATEFFQAAVLQLDLPAEQVLMIGDDIHSDIAGAKEAGLKTALVKTGKFRESDLELEIKPDYVLASVMDLPEIW